MNKIPKRYHRIAKVYDFPDLPMETGFSKWRRKLLAEAEGKVPEVGIGTGKNIPFYPKEMELTGIDSIEKMI